MQGLKEDWNTFTNRRTVLLMAEGFLKQPLWWYLIFPRRNSRIPALQYFYGTGHILLRSATVEAVVNRLQSLFIECRPILRHTAILHQRPAHIKNKDYWNHPFPKYGKNSPSVWMDCNKLSKSVPWKLNKGESGKKESSKGLGTNLVKPSAY